jgi:Reverse transcriptase (RNA-dependent DNA polymerase)
MYKIKRDANNVLERYKARIVVEGYAQIVGMEFEVTFAPVVRIESVRVLLAISAHRNLYILHVDCKNAFLNGDSDIELYVLQPEGFINWSYPHKVLGRHE